MKSRSELGVVRLDDQRTYYSQIREISIHTDENQVFYLIWINVFLSFWCLCRSKGSTVSRCNIETKKMHSRENMLPSFDFAAENSIPPEHDRTAVTSPVVPTGAQIQPVLTDYNSKNLSFHHGLCH